MSEETEQLHKTIAAQERELAVLRQAYVTITAQHRAALTALRLRVVNATGATKRAATAAAKAAAEAENAAFVASEMVAKPSILVNDLLVSDCQFDVRSYGSIFENGSRKPF